MRAKAGRTRPNGTVVVALVLLCVCGMPHAWSRDGGRIVFGAVSAGAARGPRRLFVTTPKGAGFDELTAALPWGAQPAWSNDGRSIAFSHSPQRLELRIYVMDADGGNLRRISNATFAYGDSFPTWSPRGDAIAFASAREGPGREGVYVSDIDGGEEVRITGLDTSVMWSSWRPVGDAIVYASTKAGIMDIHIMDGRGSHLAQVTDDRRWDMAPSWHPRGEGIAFASIGEDSLTGDIYTIEADGSNRRRITKHPADESEPCWSPDGTQILFESNRDGPQGLFIMDLDGRIVRRVTDARFVYIEGSDWYDPHFPRSVSPIGRHAATWGWIKRSGAAAQ